MNKKSLALIVNALLIAATMAFAQNTMMIPDVSGEPGDTLTISLEIQNADAMVAFQTDIRLPDQLRYLEQSAQLTSRSNGHSLSATLLTGNVLRVIAYSLAQSTFLENRGSVLTFQVILGSQPGTYSLSLLNPIISDGNSTNILTGFSDGTIVIYGPDIQVSPSELQFGEIPLQSSSDRMLTISNNGNQDLTISQMSIDDAAFAILESTSFDLPAYQSRTITVRFRPQMKGTYARNLLIVSNDPDQPQLQIQLNAVAYAVNELHMQDATGRSGQPLWIDFSINNMEPIVGFQFDMILPDVLSLQSDSVRLSDRRVDHQVRAEMIESNRLRVIAYSPTGQPFQGSDGKILSIGFMLKGIVGSYTPDLTNVILSDGEANNIVSAYYSGTVDIKSPDLSGYASIQFGEISVLDTAVISYTIQNDGNDTLIIKSITCGQPYFWNETPLPQRIPPWSYQNFTLKFHSDQKGSFTDRMTIRSNDPDEDPFSVSVAASAFVPNYLTVRDTSCAWNDTVTIRVAAQNYEPFVAFQFDLTIPDGMSFIDNSVRLTNRRQDHTVNASLIDEHTVRVFAFSMTQAPFSGQSGAVVELDFRVGHTTGMFPFLLSNAVLSNAHSQNILKGSQNGQVSVFDPSPVLSPLPEISIPKDGLLQFPIANWFPYVTDPDDPDSALLWIFQDLNHVQVSLSNGMLSFSVSPNWAGRDSITVIVSDGKYADSTHLFIAFFPTNTPPTLLHAPIDITVPEDFAAFAVADLDTVFVDPDGNSLNFSAQSLSGLLLPLLNGSQLILNVVPNRSGVDTIVVSATDGMATTRDTIIVTITEINDPPVIADSLMKFFGLMAGDSIRLNLWEYISDPETPDDLLKTEVRADTSGLLVNYELATGWLTVHPRFDFTGSGRIFITVHDDSGAVATDTILVTVESAVPTPNQTEVPTQFRLYQNYPNPFNGQTTIGFDVPTSCDVTIEVFDLLGKKVSVLVIQHLQPGYHKVTLDATRLPSGVYVYRLTAGKVYGFRKFLLLK